MNVYRKPDDVPARPNANHNVVGLGVMVAREGIEPIRPVSRIAVPVVPQVAPVVALRTRVIFPPYTGPGAVNTTPQLPPGQSSGSVTPNPTPPPVSPAPAPVVNVPTSQTSPTLSTPGTTLSSSGNSPGVWAPNKYYAVGQAIVDAAGHTQQVLVAGFSGPGAPNFNDAGGNTIDGSVTWNDSGMGGAATAGIGSWLAQSSLISGIPNWALAGGGLFLLISMMGKKR